VDEPKPEARPSTSLLTGFLIGCGAGMVASGLGILWLALDPSGPEDPAGILRQGLWVGPIALVVGAVFLAAGWYWLRLLASRGAGRGVFANALLGVFLYTGLRLISHGRWIEAASLAVSVGLVFVTASLANRGRGAGPA
jgi:hypothetical protein